VAVGIPEEIAQVVATDAFRALHDGVKTTQIDDLLCETAMTLGVDDPDFMKVAAAVTVSKLHKEAPTTFSEAMRKLSHVISEDIVTCASEYDEFIMSHRDYDFDYFGLITLMKAYLLRSDSKIMETPQYMLMRVALGIHGNNKPRVLESYNLMSQRYFTHATPTLFNAGTHRPQCSSCFLIAMQEDSITGIYNTLSQCASISKWAGGIGLHVHNIRCNGSRIVGTNGTSSGIVPMLRVFNATARYVDQAGKRKGAFAIFLEPWHGDVFEFLDLRKNHGDEERRCRDLFLGLWIPDLFMRRVQEQGDWSLMDPAAVTRRLGKSLSDVYGEEFDTLYEQLEREGLFMRQVKAQDLWNAILSSQIETGTPYMCYKDAVNRKSNQKNIGVIKSSNLCTEIMEYTDPDEIAVCNLGSICLPRFVRDGEYDFEELRSVTKVLTRNLNRVIDVNFYPVAEAAKSNSRHRPVGLGVQGLADVFAMMRMPFDSPEARDLNRRIFETIYYAAVETSVELAKEFGPYQSFQGSPASQGILSPDMWGVAPITSWDWDGLRRSVVQHGMRNSLLVAPMPTASTSQIMGFNECFEPFTTNIYSRNTKAGNFIVVNKYLIAALKKLDMWNTKVKESIIAAEGSVQQLNLPDDVKALYQTSWELKQRALIDLAADRGAFIDQSQSLNLFMSAPTHAKLTGMHIYAWKSGLKTGMYYLRTKAVAQAIKVTVSAEVAASTIPPPDEQQLCLSCSA
jgi:ribonucleoside-diphosphate reductase alpha chain